MVRDGLERLCVSLWDDCLGRLVSMVATTRKAMAWCRVDLGHVICTRPVTLFQEPGCRRDGQRNLLVVRRPDRTHSAALVKTSRYNMSRRGKVVAD